VPTARQMVEYKLNKLSCDFMAAGVKFGLDGMKAGGQAAGVGGGAKTAATVIEGAGAKILNPVGDMLVLGGGAYGLGMAAYAAFWQGSGYITGCNAYGAYNF
jgi:hypothetical protein